MDELRYRDPEISPEEADYECMQDRDQEQPVIQLEISDDHFPIHERNGKTSLPKYSLTNTLGSRNLSVNWYDMTIVETERQMEQFIGN